MIDVQVAGKRIFKRFASMADAEVEAATLRDQRDYEGRAGFLLPADIRAAAVRCMERLHPFNATIEQAVDYFVAHKLRYLEKPTVDTGVKTILAELDGKRGVRTVDNLRWYWTRFAAEFGSLKFSEVEPVRITAWLDRTAPHPTTRHNYRRAVVRLFKTAIANDWCVDNPAAKSRKDDQPAPEPEVFTPEEVAALLTHADDHNLLPYVVLGTFCGIRVSELSRLNWSKVNLAERAVIVEAKTTKTKTRRVVELNDTAVAWLTPHAKKAGAVVDTTNIRDRLKALAKAAGIKHWPHNAMRHSFGSYALSAWQDVPKVAYQMGNSPQVCKRHYEQIVTKSAAASFWSLCPAGADNIVAMSQTANA